MPTATELKGQMQHIDDERTLHKCVQRFTEKWTVAMDLNKRDAAEFAADFVTVIQAVHRDASRETHKLLERSLVALPPMPIIVEKK